MVNLRLPSNRIEPSAVPPPPLTLQEIENLACDYLDEKKDYGNAKLHFRKALEGYKKQRGKDSGGTVRCAQSLAGCLYDQKDKEGLANLLDGYPCINEQWAGYKELIES